MRLGDGLAPAAAPRPLMGLAAAGRRLRVTAFWGLVLAIKLLTFWGLAALYSGPARAQEPLPVPALTARVIDQTQTLSASQRQALEDKLAAFEAQAGPQIVVLMVPTTQPEDIAAFAQRVGETWKIGRRDVGDGLLLVVAKNDRRLWIAPAKALEGAVPDLAARQIVRDVISPAFKAGDWHGGLDRGLDRLFERIRGEGLKEPSPTGSTSADDGFQLEDLIMFFFVGVPVVGAVLSGLFGRRLGSALTAAGTGAAAGWLSHSLWLGLAAGAVALVLVGLVGVSSTLQRAARRGRGGRGPVVFGDGGWGAGGSGGFGGFGGGGGGFSSGGGGDFGGGGAGGDW